MKLLGILVAIALLMVGGSLLYKKAAASPGPMPRDEFARVVRALASDAHESALFAALLAGGSLTASYTEAHRQTLEDDVNDEARKLDSAPPPGLERQGESARALSRSLAGNLKRLKEQLADPAAVAKLRDEFARAAASLEQLEPAS